MGEKQAAKIILPGEGEVDFDKLGPQGPPVRAPRPLPERFRGIEKFLTGIATDEGLLMDICLERAIKIVEWNHANGSAGIDFFAENTQVAPITQMMVMAVPLAIELYKQCLGQLNQPQTAAEWKKIVDEIKIA